jgi:hypothetical protein
MKKLIIVLTILFFIFSSTAMAISTFYIDYVNGLDSYAGDSFVAGHPWKTFTLGATAARIAPGDIIHIAKSPAPTSIGNGTWTHLSKTVTLATSQNLTVSLCENIWTNANDGTSSLVAVATDAKEGSYCTKVLMDSATQANKLQAYWATGTIAKETIDDYQKISFWFKNNAAVADATTWYIALCSDVAGADVLDIFVIPAIPSTARWIPLTIARTGGTNLGNNGATDVKSIALYSGATAPTNSCNVLLDDFIACTTDGLNLQSLISKNSAERGGSEGWYGIQSINGVTVLLDTETNTKANAGRGYSTTGTTPETVPTYKRETTKTDLSTANTTVQQVMDSGSLAVGNIQFQGGYNTSNDTPDGETFFDGLSGSGTGIVLTTKQYITLNYLNVVRYYTGIYFNGSSNNTITNLNNANNNQVYGIQLVGTAGINNTITLLGNANNNGTSGVYYYTSSSNNIIYTLSNANNNGYYGVNYSGTTNNNLITLLSNTNNNGSYGVYYDTTSKNNIIRSLSTTGNTTGGVYYDATSAPNYLNNALIVEGTEISFTPADYSNLRVYSNNHDQDTTKNFIYTDGGLISSVATDRVGGTGIMWKLAVTSNTRTSSYPLKLSIAKIACVADKLVTVKAYMKITSTTDILGALVCPGGQLSGMTVADYKVNTSAADTNWHELTITFTPSEIGVVEIEAWAWWVAGTADESIYVEDMTITQAV